MEKLESDINSLMNEINQAWVKNIKEAEKTGEGIDLSEMFGKYAEIVEKKEKSFQEAKVRGSKKKGLLG